MRFSIEKFAYPIAASSFAAAISLASIRVYSAYLGAEQMGTLMLYAGGLTLAESLFSMALSQTTYYFANQSFDLDIFSSSNARWKIIATACGVIIISICFIKYYSLWSKHGLSAGIIGFSLLLALYICMDSARAVFLALNHMRDKPARFAVLLIAEPAATLIITSGVFMKAADPVLYLPAVLISKAVTLVLATASLKKTIAIAPKLPNTSDTKSILWIYRNRIFRHFAPISVMGLLGWATSFLDRYVVASALGPAYAGYYALAGGVIGRPYNILSSTLTTALRPRLYKSRALHLQKGAALIWITATLVFGVISSAFINIFKDGVVTILFAEEFRSHIMPLLLPFCLISTLIVITHCFDNIALAKGDGKNLLKIQILCVFVSAAAITLGGLMYGLTGVLIGRISSESIKLVAAVTVSRRTKLKCE